MQGIGQNQRRHVLSNLPGCGTCRTSDDVVWLRPQGGSTGEVWRLWLSYFGFDVFFSTVTCWFDDKRPAKDLQLCPTFLVCGTPNLELPWESKAFTQMLKIIVVDKRVWIARGFSAVLVSFDWLITWITAGGMGTFIVPAHVFLMLQTRPGSSCDGSRTEEATDWKPESGAEAAWWGLYVCDFSVPQLCTDGNSMHLGSHR